VIATTASGPTYAPDELTAACEKSLKRLQTDYIDIYQLHWPRDGQAPAEQVFRGVESLMQAGKIRHFGVCNFGLLDLTNLLAAGVPVTDQLCYSLLWRGIEYEIVPKCRERGIGILTYSSLVHGLLSGKYESVDSLPASRARTLHFSGGNDGVRHGQPGQEALTNKTLARIRQVCIDAGVSMADAAFGWVMNQPQVTSVLAGARTPEQVRQNAGVADTELPESFLNALTGATEDLKNAFGKQADMWLVPGRIR
jgi:aryl-alcohol dehydrogenase-like predicted oxidoreductase